MRLLKHLSDPMRLLCRLDLDIPSMANGAYESDLLFQKSVDTIKALVAGGHAVLIVSHRGFPDINCLASGDSLSSFIPIFERICGKKVHWLPDWPYKSWSPQLGEVYLAENTRLLSGELNAKPELAAKMLKAIDAIVYDALSVAHLNHASTAGITQSSVPVYSGLALERELKAFSPSSLTGHGCGLILGGASAHSKIPLLPALSERFDWVMVAGTLIPAFVKAKQGQSESDSDFIAAWLLNKRNIHLPLDVCLIDGSVVSIENVVKAADICDIGPRTAMWWGDIIRQSVHSIWYGSVGFHEFVHGRAGSEALMREIAASSGISMVLGYDTVALCQSSGYLNNIDQYSFAGEALLHAMLNKPLVALNQGDYEEIN